jgi:hypothetical protein
LESGSGRHVARKPADCPFHDVPAVGGVDKPVPFIGVNNQLGGDVLIAQAVPKLKGLGRGTLAIAVTHDN